MLFFPSKQSKLSQFSRRIMLNGIAVEIKEVTIKIPRNQKSQGTHKMTSRKPQKPINSIGEKGHLSFLKEIKFPRKGLILTLNY